MGTTFQLGAIDQDMDALWDEEGVRSSTLTDLRVCRSTNCEKVAHRGDDFCPRCRDEIDALREMYARKLKRQRS